MKRAYSKVVLVLGVALLMLTACGGKSGGGSTAAPATTGTISGKLFVGPTSTKTVVAAGAVVATGAVGKTSQPTPVQPAFVMGEAIVQFKSGSDLAVESARMIALFAADGLVQRSTIPLVHAVTFSSNITKDYRKGTLAASAARKQTLALIARLQADSLVQSVTPNHISQAQTVPNDPGYRLQWDYPAIGLEQAWDITTGSPNVIVAVLDTGIFPHPDLNANVIAGYDFISDPVNAGDGDGIDPNPAAVATIKEATHGTHVAGTIAAVSNNRVGVTGVAWQSKIMPIRVIGKGGVTDPDLINGIAYAADLANSSGTLPAKAANIINMSLGGAPVNSLMQQAIDAAVAAGVTVVAAAGNDALKGNPVNYPCAYNNVICVGAIAPNYTRSTFSEFNQFVDIVAPGGEQNLGSWANILSTVSLNGTPTYETMAGTSMASPHIAGVAALMLAANSALTPAQITQMLTSTAYDLGVAGKDNQYGYGVVNAYRAVALVKGLAITAPVLLAQPSSVQLDTATLSTPILIRNVGGGNITVSSATTNAAWLTASLNQTTTPATLTLTASPTGQSATILTTSVTVATSTGSKTIQVSFDNRATPDPGVITVELLDTNGKVVATTTTTKAKGYAYQFNNITPGNYDIDAMVDRDGSGKIDNWGEYSGTYPMLGSAKTIAVTAGSNATATNFQMHERDNTIKYDGNGQTPIRGAILARVKDAEGNPIAGAKVYIGSGAAGTGTSNTLGRATIFGTFSGAQTVTATAPGYTTLTYWKTNASYLTFSLDKITTANVALNITLTGLVSGETGVLFTDAGRQTFTATAATMTFATTQQNLTPFAISAITFNASGANHLFASSSITTGITAATNMTLAMANPPTWANFTGSIVYPAGNFDLTTVTPTAFGFIYRGLNQPVFINGYQSVSNKAAVSMRMAFTNSGSDPYGNAVGLIAVNGLGESSMVMQLGSLLPSSPTALPTTATAIMQDVPALVSPTAGNTTASVTPTFTWTNTFTPMLQLLSVLNPTTSQVVWELYADKTVSSITLPNIPTGGLKAVSNYQWNVDDGAFQGTFDFNNFNADLANQSMTALSESKTLAFVTP